MKTKQEQVFENTIEIKKSKFIAIITTVNNKDELNSFLNKYSQKKARHNCYAYNFFDGSIHGGHSDDGEPKNTAGKPIFNVIEKQKLNNVCVVCVLVIRYFGGIKLGAGPLTRAYIKSTSEVIKKYLIEKDN